MTAKDETSDKDIFLSLGRIEGKLDGLIETQQKTIYAVIALAAAAVGLKIVGSPPAQVMLFYVKTFIFVLAVLVAWWKRGVLRGWYYLASWGTCAAIAQFSKVLIGRETIPITAMFLLGNLSMVLFLWGVDRFGFRRPE